MKRKCEWIKENALPLLLKMATVFVVVMLAIITTNSLPKAEKVRQTADTIYIDSHMTDSLLLDLVNQIHEINTKMNPKKVYIKSKPDTIRIDANIKLN